MDRLERIVSYNGGFSLHGYFLNFNRRSEKSKGMPGILPFITEPLEGVENKVYEATYFA